VGQEREEKAVTGNWQVYLGESTEFDYELKAVESVGREP
jgi:hypothetical protein